jgi:hypothetical protein
MLEEIETSLAEEGKPPQFCLCGGDPCVGAKHLYPPFVCKEAVQAGYIVPKISGKA